MPPPSHKAGHGPDKITLGENHRRAVSVLFRGLERACDDALAILDRDSTPLVELQDDIPSSEQLRLRSLAVRLKDEIRAFMDTVPLDAVQTSRRRSIAALLSAALIDVEEAQGSGLRGYGPLPADARSALDASLSRISAILDQMRSLSTHA